MAKPHHHEDDPKAQSPGPSAPFDFWTGWLSSTFISIMSLAALLALFDHRAVPFLPALINESVWQQPDMPEIVVTYHRWLYGVIGSALGAWALALFLVVRHPFRAREPWAWWCVAGSLMVWYGVDTASSIAHGVWPNVPFNTLGAIAIGLPLLMTRKAFTPDPRPQAPSPRPPKEPTRRS